MEVANFTAVFGYPFQYVAIVQLVEQNTPYERLDDCFVHEILAAPHFVSTTLTSLMVIDFYISYYCKYVLLDIIIIIIIIILLLLFVVFCFCFFVCVFLFFIFFLFCFVVVVVWYCLFFLGGGGGVLIRFFSQLIITKYTFFLYILFLYIKFFQEVK